MHFQYTIASLHVRQNCGCWKLLSLDFSAKVRFSIFLSITPLYPGYLLIIFTVNVEKISRKCWQNFSHGGNFHDSNPISFLKAYGFYFQGGIFCEEDKSMKNAIFTPTRKFPRLRYLKLEGKRISEAEVVNCSNQSFHNLLYFPDNEYGTSYKISIIISGCFKWGAVTQVRTGEPLIPKLLWQLWRKNGKRQDALYKFIFLEIPHYL